MKSRLRPKAKEAENGGAPCVGNAEELQPCNLHDCPIDCKWGEWMIGVCDKKCGKGKRKDTRKRKVLASYNGNDCIGSTQKTEDCNIHSCPGLSQI